jgi:PIN domain nuclease of toxin-antitoxin system
VARLLTSFGLSVTEVTAEDGERAAAMWQPGSVLSLADRLCLALGYRLEAPVVTSDAAWTSVPGGLEVVVLR